MARYYLSYRAQIALQEEVSALHAQIMANHQEDGAADAENRQSENEADASMKLKELHDQMQRYNRDYVFWLTISGTEMSYPVVQRDNSYYLTHDFYGKKNAHGALFVDEGFASNGNILLIHGHHMKDGTMFAGLKQYKNADWRKEHLEAELFREQDQLNYHFFAGLRVDLTDSDSFVYEKLPSGVEAEEAIESYLQEVKKFAFWYEEPEYVKGDHLLILSTCDYGTADERLVIYGISHQEK